MLSITLEYLWIGYKLAKVSHKSLDVIVLSSLGKTAWDNLCYVNIDWFVSCCCFVVHQIFEWERGIHEKPKHTHGKEVEEREETEREKRKGKIWTCGIIAQWFITGCALGPKMCHDEVNRWHSISFVAPLNVAIWIIWAHSWDNFLGQIFNIKFVFLFFTLGCGV